MGTILGIINNNLVKSLTLDVIIVHAKYINLFQQDQKSVECTGYQEEKTLMLQNGDHLVNVIILVRSIIKTIL